jgi:inner membrane protein
MKKAREKFMDTITHGLFGYTIYKGLEKDDMGKKHRYALLFTAMIASQAPDVDVIANVTETGRAMSQMWHRGLTHSIFLVPVWALLIYWLTRLLFRVQDRKLFYVALGAVWWHDTIDLSNAWGTGYFEPFSNMRISIGAIPIVDLVFWGLFLIGVVLTLLQRKKWSPAWIYRGVAIAMLLHFAVQTTQGIIIEQQAKQQYEQTELAATFVPWKFRVIGKTGGQVEITEKTIFTKAKHVQTLTSKEDADLKPLFEKNPRAAVLYEWSPFVVVIDDGKKLGIADPRLLRGGEYLLMEFITK